MTSKSDETLRYRVELINDVHGNWFAQVEYHNQNGTHATQWTKTTDTWAMAMELAGELIATYLAGISPLISRQQRPK